MKLKEIISKIEELSRKDVEKNKNLLNVLNAYIFREITAGDNSLNLMMSIIENSKTTPFTACGVDGSKYEVELSDVTLIVARAVKVAGIFNGSKHINLAKEDLKIIDNFYEKSVISNKSTIFMLSLETNILKECEDCDIIFIDGPIVDPPVYYTQDIKVEGFLDLETFIKHRSSIINELVKKGKLIFGITKMFTHRFLVNEILKNKDISILKDSRENFVVGYLFLKFRTEKNEYKKPLVLGWTSWDRLLNDYGLEDMKGISKAYEKYKEVLGDYSIYSAYYQYDVVSPIARIDIISKEPPTNNIIEYINTWAHSSIREITILNKLADDLSEISNETAHKYAKIFEIMRDFNKPREMRLLDKIMENQ